MGGELAWYGFMLSHARAAYLFLLLNISTWLVMLFFSDMSEEKSQSQFQTQLGPEYLFSVEWYGWLSHENVCLPCGLAQSRYSGHVWCDVFFKYLSSSGKWACSVFQVDVNSVLKADVGSNFHSYVASPSTSFAPMLYRSLFFFTRWPMFLPG